MPGATLPNTGITVPSLGGDEGTWDDLTNLCWANYDAHDHTTGKGIRITASALNLTTDVTLNSTAALISVPRISFASVATPSTNKSTFVSDGTGGLAANELYWRSNAGTNVRITNAGALNVAAFTNGIGGDYASVAAELNYDSANTRYTHKGASGTNWAKLSGGSVQIHETGTSEAFNVQLVAPAALGASYDVTFATALPGSKALVQVSSAGVLTFENTGVNGLTLASGTHLTLAGAGEYKHGDRSLTMSALSAAGQSAVWAMTPGTSPYMGSTATGSMFVTIPLLVGDRLKSLTFLTYGDGAADLTTTIYTITAGMAGSSIGTNTNNNQAASWSSISIDTTDTALVADASIVVEFHASATGLRVGNITATYDHP